MSPELSLEALFGPKSIAVIGASRDPGKIGHMVAANIVQAGYKGKLYPVNPNPGSILGLELVPGVAGLPEAPDLAVICLPREKVLDAARELAEKGVRAMAVVTAGFKEVGRDGYLLEERLAALARERGIALLGPNSLGLINAPAGINASFAPQRPKPGQIAFFSQSGALCVAILDWAGAENIGFSKFVSLGNKAVLGEAEILAHLGRDPETKVVLGYCESVEDGQKFMAAAQAVTMQKPVIMVKAGVTPAGTRATSSHTGAMAGSITACRAAFHQAGIIRVNDVRTLFTLARAFATQPLPQGPNLAVVTNSGGPGILAADACEKSSLSLVRPGPETLERLRAFLPPFASLYNPVDIIGDADAERYRLTLEAVAQDPGVHAVLVLLSPTGSAQVEDTAQAIIDSAKSSGKPMFACFMGDLRIGAGRRMLLDAGVPCYGFPEPAIAAIESMYLYSEWKRRAWPVEVCFRRDKGLAERVIKRAKDIGLTELVEFQAQDLALAYELPVPETRLARTSDQAVRAAKKIGYPVVLKIASPQIASKSDVDGVAVGLETPSAVRRAFLDITSRAARLRPGAYVLGCLVQAMAPRGSREALIRLRRDPQFGPLISFGLGGVYDDVLRDASFRLAPLTVGDAQEMIREIQTFPLLRGVRGAKAANLRALEDILLTVSQLALDFPEIVEAEFDPILVNEDGAVVADMRMTIA
ncbi:MAG: acetate--CoA ligase family protein [Desulfovibrionaceae bacterium]|nr:acetate--CoA ligase family protein [Desulfovibrionaceae bacterium]